MRSLTVEVCALNECQDKFSGKVFARMEVIPCEVRAFWAFLQDEIQLSVRHFNDLTVAKHVLDFLQDLQGSVYYRIYIFNAPIWAYPCNPLCHFQVHLFFTRVDGSGLFAQ